MNSFLQFDEFLCYRKQEIITSSNILVGLKRLSYHRSFCTGYARPSESRKDLIPFEVGGEHSSIVLRELILADFFNFFGHPYFCDLAENSKYIPAKFSFYMV